MNRISLARGQRPLAEQDGGGSGFRGAGRELDSQLGNCGPVGRASRRRGERRLSWEDPERASDGPNFLRERLVAGLREKRMAKKDGVTD